MFLVFKDQQEQLDLPAHKVLKDLKALKVHREPKDQQEYLAFKVFHLQVLPDSKVDRAHKVLPDQQDFKVHADRKATQVV